MFRNHRLLRRWAARVLLVWLFGVVTGVAHACWMDSHVQAAGPHAHAAATDAHDHDARSACQAYCDGASVSISPLKSPVDTTAAPVLAMSPFAIAVPLAGSSPVHLLMPRRDGGQAPPVWIAFLRLTL